MKRLLRYRVLVLDADMVPSLTIARSLARLGCHVDVAAHTQRPLSSLSNAVSECFQCPEPLGAPDKFVAWLVAHLQDRHYDLVIPVTERTVVPLSASRDSFAGTRIALPEAESLELALDKSATLDLAKRVGVPVPHSVQVASLEDLRAVVESLRFPLVLKPARSIGSGGQGAAQLQVSYAFDRAGLDEGCRHALKFGPVLLQEYCQGVGVGIELIARDGEILYAFQHERVHEVPLTGGGSSLRKSQAISPSLMAASERLIAAMNWTGVAMVEFKRDMASGDYWLMEINGRFWGSLPLAAAAGADFPAMLVSLELEGDIGPAPPYREGVYCRLLSRDLHWYEALVRRDFDERIVSIPSPVAVMRELGLLFSPRHRFDVQSLRDPKPGIADLGQIAAAYIRRGAGVLRSRLFRWRQRRAWRTGDVAERVGSAKSILLVCYGNINRSALADVMLRAYAEDAGISVVSAGFHPEGGREADPVMVEVAADSGVDLSRARSTVLTTRMLEESDIIFVMEQAHYDRLITLDHRVGGKTILLGAHPNDAGWPAEIYDPYGHPAHAYRVCFERIAAACDRIKAMIAMRAVD